MSKGKKNIGDSSNDFLTSKKIPLLALVIFMLSILVYGNTILHDYAQDDAIVITDNKFTVQGLSGIPGLYKYDTFYGFFKTEGKSKLVSGGRYRPFTPMLFAIEYAVFGQKPWIGHLFNLLYFGLLCVCIFYTALSLLGYHKLTSGVILVSFLASILFAVHPIHTEVVANIKGRDEIMALLFSIMALWISIKATKKYSMQLAVASFFCFFCGLLSKENTITYLAVIPLALYLFCNKKLLNITKVMLPAIAATILFLVIRTLVLGADFGSDSMELMNNPFLKIEGNSYVPFDFSEKFSTIVYTLGRYLGLLVFPHPLTHDYYPRHIEKMTLGNWQVWLSVLAYIILSIFAVIKFKSKNIPAFSILYFFITLSIVSNIVFPIGTNMSERFLFMPSVGFCLLASVMAYKYLHKKLGKAIYFSVVSVIIILLMVKTMHRNGAWYNDETLFLTDVHTSKNSAKINNAAGGALVTKAGKLTDAGERIKLAQQAETYLTKAINVHPNYKNAYLLLGTAHYYQGKLEEAKLSYEKALIIDPEFADAQNNLAVTFRDIGRKAGQEENDLKKAVSYLKQSYALSSRDPETIRLLGVCHGALGEHLKAVQFFEQYIQMIPNDPNTLSNLATAYQNLGKNEEAEKYFNKARELSLSALNQ